MNPQEERPAKVEKKRKEPKATPKVKKGGDDEGESGKKKKRRKKDPNAPKRPLTSFMLYSMEEREVRHPNLISHREPACRRVCSHLVETLRCLSPGDLSEIMSMISIFCILNLIYHLLRRTSRKLLLERPSKKWQEYVVNGGKRSQVFLVMCLLGILC